MRDKKENQEKERGKRKRSEPKAGEEKREGISGGRKGYPPF
jgi:hypothetical protein